jgi:hypothetical protein
MSKLCKFIILAILLFFSLSYSRLVCYQKVKIYTPKYNRGAEEDLQTNSNVVNLSYSFILYSFSPLLSKFKYSSFPFFALSFITVQEEENKNSNAKGQNCFVHIQ